MPHNSRLWRLSLAVWSIGYHPWSVGCHPGRRQVGSVPVEPGQRVESYLFASYPFASLPPPVCCVTTRCEGRRAEFEGYKSRPLHLLTGRNLDLREIPFLWIWRFGGVSWWAKPWVMQLFIHPRDFYFRTALQVWKEVFTCSFDLIPYVKCNWTVCGVFE